MFCFLAPLILAAQHTRLLIVYQLLLRGERIEKPHGYTCLCKSCRKSSASDSFRHAQIFKLGSELRDLARVEHYFGKEYNKLANQLSIFVARLLDNIRGHRELEVVLNKTGRAHEEKYEPLSHSNCQQKLNERWYRDLSIIQNTSLIKRFCFYLAILFSLLRFT